MVQNGLHRWLRWVIVYRLRQTFRQLYGQFHHDQNLSPRYHAVVEENIRYGPYERNVLDLYVPVDAANSARNVVVYSHGGGLVGGDKALYKGSLYANIGQKSLG